MNSNIFNPLSFPLVSTLSAKGENQTMITFPDNSTLTNVLITLSNLLRDGFLTPCEYVELLHLFFEQNRKEKTNVSAQKAFKLSV